MPKPAMARMRPSLTISGSMFGLQSTCISFQTGTNSRSMRFAFCSGSLNHFWSMKSVRHDVSWI